MVDLKLFVFCALVMWVALNETCVEWTVATPIDQLNNAETKDEAVANVDADQNEQVTETPGQPVPTSAEARDVTGTPNQHIPTATDEKVATGTPIQSTPTVGEDKVTAGTPIRPTPTVGGDKVTAGTQIRPTPTVAEDKVTAGTPIRPTPTVAEDKVTAGTPIRPTPTVAEDKVITGTPIQPNTTVAEDKVITGTPIQPNTTVAEDKVATGTPIQPNTTVAEDTVIIGIPIQPNTTVADDKVITGTPIQPNTTVAEDKVATGTPIQPNTTVAEDKVITGTPIHPTPIVAEEEGATGTSSKPTPRSHGENIPTDLTELHSVSKENELQWDDEDIFDIDEFLEDLKKLIQSEESSECASFNEQHDHPPSREGLTEMNTNLDDIVHPWGFPSVESYREYLLSTRPHLRGEELDDPDWVNWNMPCLAAVPEEPQVSTGLDVSFDPRGNQDGDQRSLDQLSCPRGSSESNSTSLNTVNSGSTLINTGTTRRVDPRRYIFPISGIAENESSSLMDSQDSFSRWLDDYQPQPVRLPRNRNELMEPERIEPEEPIVNRQGGQRFNQAGNDGNDPMENGPIYAEVNFPYRPSQTDSIFPRPEEPESRFMQFLLCVFTACCCFKIRREDQ